MQHFQLENMNDYVNLFLLELPFIVAVIIWIVRCVTAVKRGFVKEVFSLICVVLAGIIILLIVFGISTYMEKEIAKVLFTLIMLIVMGLIYKLLSLLFKSLELVSSMPLIRLVDKLAGIVIATAETVALVWVAYCLVIQLGLGAVGNSILKCVQYNSTMAFLYDYNYLYTFILSISEKLTASGFWKWAEILNEIP